MYTNSFSLKIVLAMVFILEVTSFKALAQENAFTYLFSAQPAHPKVSYRNNIFELKAIAPDTVLIENIENGTIEKKVSKMDLYPIKMNDLLIASPEEVQSPALPARSLNEYFIDFALKNKNKFSQLADGRYRIDARHFVINEDGKMVYYKFDGLETILQQGGPDNDKKNDQIKAELNRIIHEFIISEEMHFEAAKKERKKILSVIMSGANVDITVKDHKMTVDL